MAIVGGVLAPYPANEVLVAAIDELVLSPQLPVGVAVVGMLTLANVVSLVVTAPSLLRSGNGWLIDDHRA